MRPTVTKAFKRAVHEATGALVWYDQSAQCWRASWLQHGCQCSVVFGPACPCALVIEEVRRNQAGTPGP